MQGDLHRQESTCRRQHPQESHALASRTRSQQRTQSAQHRLVVRSATKLSDLSAADSYLCLAAWLLHGHTELCALSPSAACSCVGLLHRGKLQRHAIRMYGGFLEAKVLQQSAAGQDEWCLGTLQTPQRFL